MAAEPKLQTSDETPNERLKRFNELRDGLIKELMQIPATAHAATPDRVNKQFIIRTDSPIPELSTTLARAFVAADEKDPSRNLYALVCDSHMPIRNRVIKALSGVSVPYITTMVTNGITQVSGFSGRRMVIIYERPRGKTLSSIFAERGYKAFPENFIIERIMAPLGAAVNHCAEMGFSHGRINPDNIFFGETVTLGECASEPCGYSQPYFYEPPERAQAHLAGKGEGLPAQDFFAMGVLGAYLRVGPRLFDASKTCELHIYRMLREGSYQGLTQNIDFSDAMTDLLRGTLNDKVNERWTWQQMKLWTDGRRFNMLPPNVPAMGTRPFYIDKNEYMNIRDLAQGLFDYWDITHRLLREGSVIRWVDLSARRKDIAELLRKSVSSMGGAMGQHAHQNDELVARSISIIDPEAPLSMKGIRMRVDGVGPMIAEGMRNGVQHHVQHVVETIEQGLANIWADMHRRRDEELSSEMNNAIWMLDRMRMTLRRNTLGFGLERVLYDLTPDLPCQSPLLGDNCVLTLKDLLLTLDRLASEKVRDNSPLDRHIAAFISSKLNLAREVWLSDGGGDHSLGQHPGFVALKLFEQAQESAGRTVVPALTLWTCIETLEAIEKFHSRSLREQLESGLRKLSSSGQFRPLEEFINQKIFLEMDNSGFKQALMRHRTINHEIMVLRDKRINRRRAANSGYAFAKNIAYGVLAAVIAFIFHIH